MGKKERAYLRGIVSELEDCIERENISSKQDLYTKYRQPYDLANDYYSRFETDEIVKKIRVSKYIKMLLVSILCALLLVTLIYSIRTIRDHYVFNQEEIVTNNDSLVENEEYSEHEAYTSGNFIEEEEIIE